MMRASLKIAIFSAVVCSALSSPLRSQNIEQLVLTDHVNSPGAKSNPRPLVIWHGLGDTAHAEGITSFMDDIKEQYPGIYVHSVQIPEGGNNDAERKAGFFGKAEDQAQEGCEQIASIPELSNGFDAMGFSQGGLFLRSYVEFCNDPPVYNLMTFGTPHQGISALLPCPTPPTLSCLLAARAARSGIYTKYAQDHLIQAQYYRDVDRLDEFWEVNTFLTSLNNDTDSSPERASDAEEGDRVSGKGRRGLRKGKGRVDGLENFIAVAFDADRTVSPGQSAHFWTYTPGNKTVLLPLEEQPIYKEDRIGLRTLDEKEKLHLIHCPGEHMDLDSGDCAKKIVDRWVGWDT